MMIGGPKTLRQQWTLFMLIDNSWRTWPESSQAVMEAAQAAMEAAMAAEAAWNVRGKARVEVGQAAGDDTDEDSE